MDQLYKHIIMDLYRDPSYRGTLKHYTATCSQQNSLCGDQITFYLLLDKKMVKKIRFYALGCVLSQAAATFICKQLEGNIFELKQLSDSIFMQKALGLSLGPSRLRCIMLPIECLIQAKPFGDNQHVI